MTSGYGKLSKKRAVREMHATLDKQVEFGDARDFSRAQREYIQHSVHELLRATAVESCFEVNVRVFPVFEKYLTLDQHGKFASVVILLPNEFELWVHLPLRSDHAERHVRGVLADNPAVPFTGKPVRMGL